jgi:hypothetical protein
MKYRWLLLSLIVLVSISPALAGVLDNWYIWLHVPPDYAKAPNIIYYLFVPFLAVWAVAWGLLTKIGIFNGMKNVNLLISLMFAISGVYYQWMFKLVHFLLSLGSTVAFVAFAIMFFIGIRWHAKAKVREWKRKAGVEDKPPEKKKEDGQN